MTAPASVNTYGMNVGTYTSMVPYVSSVAPASTNLIGPNGPFPIGQVWINSVANTVYFLTSLSSSAGVTSATWTAV